MPDLTSAATVAVVALLVPLLLRLFRVRLPEVVVEIVLGIVIGPHVLGWAHVDEPVRVLSMVGLGFLLLLAGLEIDVARLRGSLLRRTAAAFGVSFVLALAVGAGLAASGLISSPLLVAVILSATSLGIVLPVLEDARQTTTPVGEAVVAGASIAEVVPIVLLSLLFSAGSAGLGARVLLFAVFLALVAVLAVALGRLEQSRRLSRALLAIQDTTAQIRVRGAFALLMVLTALASAFGLEIILGAFLAGVLLRLVDRDEQGTHTLFQPKLRGVGFGVFVPFFFVSTGMSLDVGSLVTHPAGLLRVPLFLGALLVVRAMPALFYRSLFPRRSDLVAAGLLQATSLSIPVVAGGIGVELGLIRPVNEVALVAAGLLSVVLFPLLALRGLSAPNQPSAQSSD